MGSSLIPERATSPYRAAPALATPLLGVALLRAGENPANDRPSPLRERSTAQQTRSGQIASAGDDPPRLCCAGPGGGPLFRRCTSLAAELHRFSTSFGEAGSGNGQLALTNRSGVAVNTETGDVYVADTSNSRVQEFEANGTFVRSFPFTAPAFIAIDNSGGASQGDVYVANPTADSVSKFDANGTLVTSWGNSGHLTGNGTESFGSLAGIAVDPTGVPLGLDHLSPPPLFLCPGRQPCLQFQR